MTEYEEKTKLFTCLFQGTSNGRPLYHSYVPSSFAVFFGPTPSLLSSALLPIVACCGYAVDAWMVRYIDALRCFHDLFNSSAERASNSLPRIAKNGIIWIQDPTSRGVFGCA